MQIVGCLDSNISHFREYKTPPSKDVLKVKITEIEHDILKVATVVEQLERSISIYGVR
jgi:hypothetical protein